MWRIYQIRAGKYSLQLQQMEGNVEYTRKVLSLPILIKQHLCVRVCGDTTEVVYKGLFLDWAWEE